VFLCFSAAYGTPTVNLQVHLQSHTDQKLKGVGGLCISDISEFNSRFKASSWGTNITCNFYNHARRPRLEIEKLSQYLQGFLEAPADFKPLLDPGDHFNSETAARRLQKSEANY
jgi:hypothetical protein